MSGAPEAAPAAPATPLRANFDGSLTVIAYRNAAGTGVAVTVWPVRVPTAFALQISEVPACVLLRLTSVHVSPAPVTGAGGQYVPWEWSWTSRLRSPWKIRCCGW